MPSAAPSSNEGPAPSSTTCRAGTTVYSAAVPCGRCQAASQTHTRSPTSTGSTPSPTASTVPEPSWSGTWPSGPGALGAPGLPVGRVDAGEGQPHPHLARAGLGVGALDQLQDVGSPFSV
jgi:hypothetical protein